VNWNISKMAIRSTSCKTHTFRSLYVYEKEQMKGKIESFLGELGGEEVTPLYLRSAVLSRMKKMFESDKMKYSLIIGSYITSGYVRYIENYSIDKDKLNVDVMKNNNYMLMSESTMGGVFIGFVHVLNKTEGNFIDIDLPAIQKSNDLEESTKQFDQLAKQLDQLANVNIEIEFICLGAVPSLKRFEVTSKMWELTRAEEDEILAKVANEEKVGTVEFKNKLFEEKHNYKNQRMKSLMANQGKGITHHVHTAQTLYQAFEDFTMQMNDENSGVPVSLRWIKLSRPKETTNKDQK